MTKKKEPSGKEKKPKNLGGRPTIYSKKITDLICLKVATNACGLNKLTRLFPELPDMDTIYAWRYKYPEFSRQYAEAKLKQAEFLAEEITDIADDGTNDYQVNDDGFEIPNHELVARSRLRVDTRKWLASKLLPKTYGDKIQVENKNEENEQLKEELRQLREKLDAIHKKEF